MKVAVFLADGFEEVEALTPVDLLRRAGAEVVTFGVTGKTVNGAHRIPVVADCTIDALQLSDFDIVFLPGGMPGTANLYACDAVCNAVKSFASDPSKRVAAICAAPSIVLGGLGILNGKQATCYPGMEDGMIGATPVNASCVADGNIITGRGAGAAADFALLLVRELFGAEKAANLASSICYAHYNS